MILKVIYVIDWSTIIRFGEICTRVDGAQVFVSTAKSFLAYVSQDTLYSIFHLVQLVNENGYVQIDCI